MIFLDCGIKEPSLMQLMFG